MIIQRRYEADNTALDQVVEILYKLLLEPPPTSESERQESTQAPCISPEHE